MLKNKSDIQAHMKEKLVNNDLLIKSWFQIISKDSEFAAIQKLSAPEITFTDDVIEAITNPFFLDGLKNLIIRNLVYELFLTKFRKSLLLQKPNIPDFADAMAQQCYKNGYVFYVTPEEKEALKKLGKSDLENKIRACYKNNRPPATFTGKTLVKPKNKTSLEVQDQYEKSPYPVWSYINPDYVHPINDDHNILVAGCGTGNQAIVAALSYPQAKITAIDLSTASLAYAQAKTKEFDLSDRISYMHGDLLDVDRLDEDFSVIICTGVLHHMKQPVKGMHALSKVLRKGGRMNIALYSELGRYDVNTCKSYIKEKGYKPTPDDMREFRKDIINKSGLLHDVTKRHDFFTLPECQDLFFHVQEHQFTIPEIQKLVGDLSLVRFIVAPNTSKIYEQEFPNQEQSFENWHSFEQKYPRTFKGMYKFILEKR